jgi:prepilin-type N-terminal cleavage/methylation domain-containing protein
MQHQRGFSLVELAIVILIMGLVLGGLAMPLSVQRENGRIREGREQLVEIEESIQGFALANGFIPCPATPSSGGLAASAGGGCAVQHGFVPATTLGLSGARNNDNLLLDPWASPLRYSVSASDSDGDGNWDFTNVGEMQDVTMPLLVPDLVVCSATTGSTPTACANANLTLSNQAPLVLYSLGKDWASFSSPDQIENVGANLGGGPSGVAYQVADDLVFVSRQASEQAGAEYDDLLMWTAPATLYSRLLAAGLLP